MNWAQNWSSIKKPCIHIPWRKFLLSKVSQSFCRYVTAFIVLQNRWDVHAITNSAYRLILKISCLPARPRYCRGRHWRRGSHTRANVYQSLSRDHTSVPRRVICRVPRHDGRKLRWILFEYRFLIKKWWSLPAVQGFELYFNGRVCW